VLRGRAYWRRKHALELQPRPAPVYREELDYDRLDIMDKIDSLKPGWRMLINEHGFTPVMKALKYSSDINVVERMMQQRHAARQQDLAEGRF
jgi:hypothetical protein